MEYHMNFPHNSLTIFGKDLTILDVFHNVKAATNKDTRLTFLNFDEYCKEIQFDLSLPHALQTMRPYKEFEEDELKTTSKHISVYLNNNLLTSGFMNVSNSFGHYCYLTLKEHNPSNGLLKIFQISPNLLKNITIIEKKIVESSEFTLLDE